MLSYEIRLALRVLFRSITYESLHITTPDSFPSQIVPETFNAHSCTSLSSSSLPLRNGWISGCNQMGTPYGGYDTLQTLEDHSEDYPKDLYEKLFGECHQCCLFSLQKFQYDCYQCDLDVKSERDFHQNSNF